MSFLFPTSIWKQTKTFVLTPWYPHHLQLYRAFLYPLNIFLWQDPEALNWCTEVLREKLFSNEIFPVHLEAECDYFLAKQCLLYPVLPSARTSKRQSATNTWRISIANTWNCMKNLSLQFATWISMVDRLKLKFWKEVE